MNKLTEEQDDLLFERKISEMVRYPEFDDEDSGYNKGLEMALRIYKEMNK